MGKYLIIYNPIAGKGSAQKKVDPVRKLFDRENIAYEMVFTQGVGHAIELARDALYEDYNGIIAAGGDGTCNEVVNGLMQGAQLTDRTPVMGILKVGRGNDFSYSMNIPDNLEDNVALFKAAKTEPLDIGIVKGGFYPSGRYFCNGVGIGFDTLVGFAAASMKHVHGGVAYVFGALREFIDFPACPKVKISYNDNDIFMNALQISIMNGRRMGGVFFMAPHASINDGLYDLCISHQITRRRMLRTIYHYTKGTQEVLSNITIDRTSAIRIECLEGGLAVHADGETVCQAGKKIEIEMIPQAINIIMGKAAVHD